MKKNMIFLLLLISIAVNASDEREFIPSEKTNCFMQALAAITSCPLILTRLCGATEDPRTKNPLHRTYVDPYAVSYEHENNNCCLTTHYFCPCCVPQRLEH